VRIQARNRNPSPGRTTDEAGAGGVGLVGSRLTAGYGTLQAIRDVSVHVEGDRLVGIVGPNGAGKTTLLRTLAGDIIPMAGNVSWRGRDVSRQRADVRARSGIAFVQEGRHLFGSLSVRDNLLMGAYGRNRHKALQQGADRVLGLFPALAPLLKRTARTLSGGEQQMVAIGRALMGDPECLLIDEPSLGLAPVIVDSIYQALPELCRAHVTVAVVEQEVDRVLAAARYVYVMRDGEIVSEGPSEDLRANPAVLGDLYLGKE
jgi:branched-chain amino acid transport system ATP-binding protein